MKRRLRNPDQLYLWSEETPPGDPVRIGTSGWHYRHWRGPFYPADIKPEHMLAWYAAHFDCVEIDNSFYRLPTAAGFARWRDTAPGGFAFAVKAGRYLTHVRRLREPEQAIARFVSAAAALGPKRGPALFQLPPAWPADIGRLRAFLQAWPRDWPSAWEFRDDSWSRDDVYELLAEHGAALCLHDFGGRRRPEALTAAHVYVRLHGPGQAYAGSYPDALLDLWANKLAGWVAEGRTPWVFFNNDGDGSAPRDARRLRARVREFLGLRPAA